jgi:hypothetical protein
VRILDGWNSCPAEGFGSGAELKSSATTILIIYGLSEEREIRNYTLYR